MMLYCGNYSKISNNTTTAAAAPGLCGLLLLVLWCCSLLSDVQAFSVIVPHSQPRHHRYHRMLSTTAKLPPLIPLSAARVVKTSASSTTLHAILDTLTVSPEPIHTAFNIATFGPQPFWLLLILFPKADLTKKIMGTLDVVLFFAVVHFFIVSASIVDPSSGTAPIAEFNDVFDPTGDPQKAFMNMVTNYPNFVAEEWSHVLTWDLFVGRWIWIDGLKRNIFTAHSVLFCNLIGPPGLLLHGLTSVIFGETSFLGDNEVEDISDSSNDETEE